MQDNVLEFKSNNKKYRVKEGDLDAFANEFPDAVIVQNVNNKNYRVKARDYKSFQEEFFPKTAPTSEKTIKQEEAEELDFLNSLGSPQPPQSVIEERKKVEEMRKKQPVQPPAQMKIAEPNTPPPYQARTIENTNIQRVDEINKALQDNAKQGFEQYEKQREAQAPATPVNEELIGQERINAFAKQMELQAGMNKFKSNIDKDLNAFEVASKQNTFNPTVQKVGDEYVDALGNRHSSEIEAIKTNQDLSKMYAQRPNTSLRGRRHEIENTIENSNKEYEKQLSEIEKQITDRQNIVREEHSKKINASTDKFKSYRETQPDFSSDAKLNELYELKNNLHKAHKVELHNLEQALERLNRQVDKIEGNEAGFWQGALDKVTDSRTWDFGLQDLDEALIQNNFNENYNNLSPQEKEGVNKMLEAIYRNQLLSQEYQDSKMYGYGEMLGVMPSFAVDLFTGAGLIGKGIKVGTKVGTKLATKAVGKEVAEEIAEKGTLKYIQNNGLKGARDIASQNFIKFLGQSADDIAKASIVTAVPQGMKTGAGIIDRKLGNVVEDEQGNLKFEDEKSWNNAIYNEVTDRVVEAFSEMFGGHLGKVTLKGVGELADAVGAKKIGSALLTADAKMLDSSLKKIKDAFSKVGINDLSGEALEEYYGQLWRTVLNQEDAYITNPDGSKTNLLAVKDFHVDLVVGLGLTMGAMKSVQYPFTAIDYIYTKNKVRKAGNKASVEVGLEKWKEIKQLIDNATNQDISKIVADVFLKENISGKGKLAVLDYVAKTAFLRGYNIGELSQNIEQDLSEVDKTLAERKRRENENYLIGYNAVGEQKVDIKDRYEANRQRLEELGISTDNAEGYLDLYALAEKFQRNGESAKANAVYSFINSDTQYNGLIEASKDDIDIEVESNNNIIDSRVNPDTNKIIKAKNIQGEEVYVVKGNIRVNEQGEAEIIGGDSVIIQKADGTQEMVSPTDLADYEEIEPNQLKEESNATIKQTLLQQKADEIEGIVPLQVGMQVQGLGVISAIDEQGNVAIQIEGKEEPAIIPYNSVQALLQQARVDAIKQEQAQEEQAQEVAQTPQISAEDVGLGFTADVNGETLEVVGIYEDKFMVDYQGKTIPMTKEEIAEIVNNAQPTEQPTEEVPETKENNTENNTEKNAPNEKIIGQNTDNQGVEIRKSIGNEVSKKDADYLNLSDVDAWNTLVAECNGDVETATEIVNETIEDAEKTLQKIKNAKLKRGNSVAEKIAIRNEHQQNIANAEAVLEKWKAIANVPNMQPVAEETIPAIEEVVATDVAEIPDITEDKPQDARNRGFRRVNGQRVDRQSKLDVKKGKETNVRFAENVTQQGNYTVVEASDLQPSHINGQRNPLHFIEEAQPKERTDNASTESAKRIAENIRPEEITTTTTAYVGTPTINERGEVIQGNNRGIALKTMYAGYKDSAQKYKQYLIDHAEEFGLNPADIEAMENPVLVNMLAVEDKKAIELGQYVAQDTESGGVERIKPKNVVQKMGERIKNFANILFRSSDEDSTLAELIDQNGAEVLNWLAKNNFITDTQYQSAFDSKGNLTAEAKNDLRNVLYNSLFKNAPSRLEEMFNNLPAKAQKGILATAFRDFDSPNSEKMLAEIQQSIIAYNYLLNDANFVNAKTYTSIREAIEGWRKQTQFDDATGESFLPAEKFSNFALHLVGLYKGQTQKYVQNVFNELYDLIQGTKADNLFETNDKTKRTLAEAIKEVLDIDYKPIQKIKQNGRNGSNVLGNDTQNGEERGRGSSETVERGESNEDRQGTDDSARGIRGDNEEVVEVTEEITNRSMSADEAQRFIADMELNADIAPEIELTIENWDSLFGADGIVKTPIGDVKMGENQFTKLMRQGRNGKLGMIKPTLENPHIIIEETSEAKEEDSTERPSSYIFIRSFKKADGTRYYYFTSITVSKEGKEVVISNHEKTKNRISNILQNGVTYWINKNVQSVSETQNGESVLLDDSQVVTKADNNSTSLGINSSELSNSKDTTNSKKVNSLEQENTTNLENEEVVKEENPVKQRLQELRKEYASETNMFERTILADEVQNIIKNEFGVTISFIEVGTLLEASEEDFADLLSEIEKGNNPIKAFEQRKESLSKLSKEENARRQPLRKRAKEWEGKVGAKVRVIESVDEVRNKKARQAIKAGRNVTGWYDVAQNEVYIYLPNITSEKEIDNTYLHEVVAHKGLRELLGQEKFEALCDRVWNSMSKEAQEEYAEYVGAKEKPTQKQQRAAADEYVAYLAEKTNLTEEEKNIWNKLVDWVKEVLSDIFNTKLTDEQIQDLIRASYQNLMTTSNNEEITTTSNNEEVKEEPIVNSDFQLIMSDAEFQTLIASKDKERMKKYVAQIEKSLIISEKTSPFASKEYRKVEKDIKEAIKKYGSKNIPDDLQQSLLERRQVFDDLSANLYDRLHSLEDRLRELESIEETKQKKETEAQKTKHKETAYNGFLANKNSLMATNAEKVLSKEYNFNIQGKKEVLTVAEFVEQAVKEGVELEVRTSPKYSGASNRTYNRMSNEEQKADDLRVKNSGVKKEYFVNDVNLGKTAYDYATYLQNLSQENLDSNGERFRITPAEDKAYMEAVEKGDLETAQRMVNEVAERTGYNADSKYQGSLAFNGAAPSSNGWFETKEERKEAWENGDFEGEMSLGDFVDNNIDTHDLEWQINDPRATMNEGRETIESIRNLRDVVRNKKRTIKMYRAVDAGIKENSFRNGDWITPSRSYAKYHATLQDWKRSRIIEQEVSIDDIWWNGDDINEWGFDDGKDYGYKNTKNNRKSLDAVTYDDNGNVIPLSKRFNARNEDIRFRETPTALQRATDKTMQQLKSIGIDVQMATEEQVNEVLGLAEVQEVNNPQFMIAYHGSGAKFDKFDHSFMGTATGVPLFGWGTYVSQLKSEGKVYASNGFLYKVEIPNDNGKNYLQLEKQVSAEEKERVKQALFDALMQEEEYQGAEKELRAELDQAFNKELNGNYLYGTISSYLGGSEQASQFLNSLGYVGSFYPRTAKKGNYVIFDVNDIKIKDRIEFMRTPNGVVYGWTIGGKIFLTKAGVNPNTPVHEYTHLWAEALKTNNPKLWNRIIEGLKSSPTWSEVKADKNYSDISNSDDLVASEVLSRLSGKENYNRLMEQMQKEIDQENGVFEKAEKISLLEDIKKAFNDFWNWVVKNFTNKPLSVEQAVNMPLKDFWKGVNPNDKIDDKENLPLERMVENNSYTEEMQSIKEKAIANGTYMKAPNGKKSNLNAKQWVQVRTRAFKNWFGDWEKAFRIEKLRKSKPIEITGNEITPSEDIKQYKKNALEYGKTLTGGYVNKDTDKEIRLTSSKKNGGLYEVLQHDYKDKEHIQSIAAIPQIIEESVYIDTIFNEDISRHPNVISYDYYVCGLKIGGVDYTVKAVISNMNDGSRYYDHKLTNIEKGRLIDMINKAPVSSVSITTQTPETSALSSGKDKRLFSILQINSSKIVDENGEPLVVYHGSDRRFYTFKKGDLGFHFGTQEQANIVAKEKARESSRRREIVNEYFLNIRNPFRIDYDPETWEDVGSRFLSQLKKDGIITEKQFEKLGWYGNSYAKLRPIRNSLQEAGYDGIVYPNWFEFEAGEDYRTEFDNSYITLSPNQIKSATDNVGTFSSEEDDIRFRERFIDGINQYEIIDKLDELSSWTDGFYNLSTALEDYFKGEIVSASNGAKHALERGLVPVPAHKYAGLNEEYHHIEFRGEDGETFVEAVPFVKAEDVEKDFGIRFRELENEELINEQFNKELQQQIDGTLPKGHIYQLGMPSDILLSAGFPYMPIELSSTNLAEHAKKTHHTFELNDVKGLVNALQEPIAVFTYGDKNKSQNVIVEIQKEGRNFLVGVHFNQERRGIIVSDVRGIFPKDNAEWLNWITQGKALYLNKEKIQTLINQQRKTLAEVEYLDLDSVAKILQNFENPSFSDNISERQGEKTYTDEELSYENDPIAKVLGKPRYSLPQRKAFAKRQRERMLNHAVGVIEKLHLDNVEIVTDVETLQGKRKKAKGFYNTTTGKITIVMPNHTNIYDVQETILHEAVAHYGLRKLFGEHFDTFLDNVYNNASQEVREQIVELANKNYWDFAKATEEYLASLAETTNFEDAVNTSWWQKIKHLFVKMLRNLGLNDFRGETLTDNELRYILWRSYQNLIDPNAYRNPFAVAEDVVMQDELKVGNYATINEERTKVAEEEVLFREQQEEENSIERYNRIMRSGKFQSNEALADSMASVKVVMEQTTGKKVRDIAGYENAYLGENALSSVNKAEVDWATTHLFQPLYNIVHSLAKNKEEYNALMNYLYAKHGLERNEKMREDARKANQKEQERVNKINEELKAEYVKNIIAGEQVGELKLKEPKLQKVNRDFAGLIGLTGIDSVNEAEEKAKQIVAEYENNFDTKELWEKINQINEATLKKTLDSGLISKKTYDKISSMYKYYIPLRGFDEATAEDMFSYLTNQKFGTFNSPIRHAKGRRSKADNPFAFMESMLESAIIQGNRNTLVKKRFLTFVKNHPSELFSVGSLWLQYDKANNKWVPVLPEIKEDATAEEVKKATMEFEKEMKKLAEENPDMYKNASDSNGNLPYKFEVKEDKHQHQIIVKQGGKNVVITVNGNPRVAQAINGLTNPDNDLTGALGLLLSGAQNLNRYLSTMYTSASLDFVVRNFIRDLFYSNFMVWVRENPKYALRFNGNYLRFFLENLGRFLTGKNLFRKWRKGTLNRDNKAERLFEEFMLNGGETGYVELKNIEEHKKEIAKKIKKSKDVRKMIMYQLASINRVIENNARFAAYYTSRNMGRDIARSVYDAKEISVNFNKKGAGSKFLNATGQTALGKASAFTSGAGRSLYIFWNPAIQGLAQFLRAYREHPIKSSVLTATAIGAGMANALWLSGDDEEEKYYNIPERIRRQNLIIPIGENYLALPLPIEFRAFYGLGELLYSVTSGKEYMTSGEFAWSIVEQFSQVLPINFLEGESPLMQLVPSAIKPIVEVGRNESWTGLPIYKDDSFGGIVEGHKPEYQNVYKNANPTFVTISKQINDWTGGDNVKEGSVDINPAIVEHLAKGYLGGIFNLANDITNLIAFELGDREFDVRDMPAVGAVVAKADERTQYRAVNNRYYEAKKEADEMRYLKKGYEKEIDNGNKEYNKVLEELKKTPEYKRFEIFEARRKGIDKLNRKLKKATENHNEERMKELNTKLYEEKKEMLNKWRKVNENK